MAKKPVNRRYRNYATVVYPDSSPENWQDILSDQLVPALISPLHDMDTNPDGEIKKPHWHVVLLYDAPKSEDQAQAVFTSIAGVGCEVVQSIRGYARYLCHLDNPEKHQYSPDAVRAFCGADYCATIGLPTDKYKAIGEMMDYCEQNNIFSYYELLTHSRNERFDWFRVLCDSATVVIKEYLKSRAWTTYQRSKEVSKDAGANDKQTSDGCQSAEIYSEEI